MVSESLERYGEGGSAARDRAADPPRLTAAVGRGAAGLASHRFSCRSPRRKLRFLRGGSFDGLLQCYCPLLGDSDRNLWWSWFLDRDLGRSGRPLRRRPDFRKVSD